MSPEFDDILRSPKDAAFSRVRYVARHATDEQKASFLRELYLKAVQAKDNGQWERVAETVRSLTPAQQEVIGLRFFSGLTSEEVGGLLGKGSGAVREMQSAAIKALRLMLSEEH